jgi:hypothetical protein
VFIGTVIKFVKYVEYMDKTKKTKVFCNILVKASSKRRKKKRQFPQHAKH